jgi:hypothetical protein
MLMCRQRIRELTPKWGIGCPVAIDEAVTLYHDLIRAVRERDVQRISQSLIHSPLLDASSKAQLASFMKTAAELAEAQNTQSRRCEINEFRSGQIDAFVAERTREQKASHNAALVESANLRCDCIAQFRRQLEHDISATRIDDFVPTGDSSLRQQLEQEFREAQEQAWWQDVATHPITLVVGRLKSVPGKHVPRVLDVLFRLPATDPHIHDDDVHRFLEDHCQLLANGHGTPSPVFVAYIGRLLGEGDCARASELLDLLPVAGDSPLSGVVDYYRYILGDGPDLSGATDYGSLSPEDLFLGACYYHDPSSSDLPRPPVAWPTLKQQSRWEYHRLEPALLNATRDWDTQALNDFKVSGLQPRIAELAFRCVYGRLYGTAAGHKLRDLNLDQVKQLVPPWRLDSRPTLPSADWEDCDGREYDVKSNLYCRREQDKTGLRGFFIKRFENPNHSFPGFVFTGADDESCSWVYVGEYQPIATMWQSGDRVLPFCFRLPDACRYTGPVSDDDRVLGIWLLKNSRLRIGWRLAAGVQVPLSQRKCSIARALLHAFVERCIEEAATTFLEYGLWKALTDTTLDACCTYQRESVVSFLELVKELFLSRALPIRLPRIEDTPLLCLWIMDVLRPLSDHWCYIQCPQCGRSASEQSIIRLRITRMTSAGTIQGEMTCAACKSRSDVTLLTHCRKCHHYPLIIGKNQLCACGGLICEWRDNDGASPCNACKWDCSQGRALHR